MILEFINDQVYLNDQLLDQTCYLVPNGCHNYQVAYVKSGENNDEQHIYIDPENAQIVVNTSWYGEYPLFYYEGKQHFVISSSFESLFTRVNKLCSTCLDFDKIAIFESMIFDNPLRSRTLFNGIKKFTAGKEFTFNGKISNISEKTVFVLPFDKGSHDVNERIILDNAIGILSGLVNVDLFQKNGKILVSLSGGLDSRLLVCLLKKEKLPFEIITFGPNESTEPYIAKKVAKQLGVPISHLVLKDDYYKKNGDEVTWLTGGLSCHRHCHLYACLSENHIFSDYIMHGYLGGEYAGASQPEFASLYDMSKDEAMSRFVAKVAEKTWMWRQLSTEDKDRIMDDLIEIMDENCQENLPCHFDEYLHNVDRQFSLIANVFSPVEKFGKVIRPFASKDYAVFFNSLPYKYRVGRKLYKDACSLMFPSEFKIGSQDQVFNINGIAGKIEHKFSQLIPKISYASLLFTKGKLVIRNPKGYERHREILLTTLKNDLSDSVSDMSSLLNKDLSHLKGIHLHNRQDTVAQYRVLSLHSLLKQLDTHGICITRRCV